MRLVTSNTCSAASSLGDPGLNLADSIPRHTHSRFAPCSIAFVVRSTKEHMAYKTKGNIVNRTGTKMNTMLLQRGCGNNLYLCNRRYFDLFRVQPQYVNGRYGNVRRWLHVRLKLRL